ncbi:MAG TPA: Gmad2 immunoglobulin-like domain-containing protein [Gaiellaceae bacterium]|nr:Gmad2 immunoglobulin-like domain-containing protein [Gaiellaceae bacterium]
MRSLTVLSLAFALLLAGCGGDDETTTVTVRETVTETASSSVPSEAPAEVAVYFLEQGQVWPERRHITGAAIATNTIHQLFKGTETGLTTAIPPGTRLRSLAINDGVAVIELEPRVTNRKALAQLTYTLTQFPTVKRVSFNGGSPVGRAAFEAETPAILVESPLSGDEVEPGFEASGTANTFEANFQYELRDAAGAILKKDFVTATSGSGTRGTFSFAVPYEVERPQQGQLVVFEISAENGSRTSERSISLRLR